MEEPVYHSQKITYGSYLKIPELLSLQQPVSVPAAHDEMLFIMTHQVYELWFKQILHEISEISARLSEDQALPAIQLFERVHKIQHLLIEQIPLLETMFNVDFARFRDNLVPASGFQSVQFRKLEFLCGNKNPRMLKLVGENEEAKREMEEALRSPTVYDHYLRHLDRHGYDIPKAILERDTSLPHEANDGVLDALEDVYRQSGTDYVRFRLAEHLLEFEEKFQIWRFHHVKMVERMIGGTMGTGGSSGAKYLASTLSIRFFPEVWLVRDRLAALDRDTGRGEG